MKRVHLIAAWLAVVALLLDGLLPAAVAAAASADPGQPLALCAAAQRGAALPGHGLSPLPAHHCALCAVCVGWAVSLSPSRADWLAARISAGNSLPAIARITAAQIRRAIYAAAQPRAPPEPTS